MGSYTFRWEHPAEEVFVTGTFDNWTKSTKLEKKDVVHEATVALPNTDEKILYKFVADGEWKHDPTGKTEQDHEGNTNNVINPEDIKPPNSAAQMISSVAPGATTTAMAGEQAREQQSSPAPGAFPETPAADDDQTFSVNPIPAQEGISNPVQLAPGEKVPDPSSLTSNTLTSNVRDDEELKSKDQENEQSYGVAPIPAIDGIRNPVNLQPGEKVPDPSTFTNNTVQSTVTTDKESYERSDAYPAGPGSFQGRETPGAAAVFSGVGPVIPESSTPMDNTTDITKEDTGPTISSVAPGSSTNELAGQQPIEPRGVPEVVSESRKEADFDPEASANPDAVEEKKEVEEEFMKKVPTEEPASESNTLDRGEEGFGAEAAVGAAAVGVGAAGAAVAANEVIENKAGTDPESALPESAKDAVDEKAKESSIPEKAAGESTTDAARETTSSVPEEVKESQKEAGEDAEASADTELVKEKSEVEKELLSKVPESEAKGDPAPTESAATATTAPAMTSDSGAPQLGDPTNGGLAPISMDDKPAESSIDKPAETDGLNASKESEAQPPTASKAVEEETPAEKPAEKPADSRDVSPMSKPTGASQTEPQVTTGTASSAIPRKNGPSSSTPEKRRSIVDRLKGTPESSSKTSETGDSKKEKRRSLFGRIKDKLK